MAQQQIHDTKNKLEKAVLVGVHAQDDKQFNFESTMEELSSLSETCQLEVLIANIMLVKVKLKKFKHLLSSKILM